MMDAILDSIDEHRIAELCMPRDVEIDFAVDILGHVGLVRPLKRPQIFGAGPLPAVKRLAYLPFGLAS